MGIQFLKEIPNKCIGCLQKMLFAYFSLFLREMRIGELKK